MKFHDIPLPRRIFRGTLLVIMGMALAFFVFIVFLRVAYRDAGIEGPLQTAVFEADIMQHHAWAAVSSDEKDMEIAEELLKLGFFSPLYTQAGVEMLEAKAEDGYQPAIDRLYIIPDRYKSAVHED